MKKAGVLLVLLVLLAGAVIAEAQQAKKIPRIGFLSASRPQPQHEAFRQGLRELGYVEGQNTVIEWGFAEGDLDRVSHHAVELVRLTVDVIVTGGPSATRAAKEATSTIPIVMAFDNDPVGNWATEQERHEQENCYMPANWLSNVHCSIRRGTAVEESPTDRVYIRDRSGYRFHPCGGNSAGSACAWPHRRTEHRHRVPIYAGEGRSGP